MATGINWTDESWNPSVGCSKISPGCVNCYAAEAAKSARLQQFPQYQEVKDWDGTIAFVEDALDKPLKWKKPKKIFVCSMSDLFHENVPDKTLLAVFDIIRHCPQHTFQILTKRPENALRKFWELDLAELPNVWMGVTVENQEMANQRIPILLQIPADKRWLSMEPLLGKVNLSDMDRIVDYLNDAIIDEPPWKSKNKYDHARYGSWEDFTFLKAIDWVVVGGESGKNARPCNIEWIEAIAEQCKEANVPVWVKQMGKNSIGDTGYNVRPANDPAWSKFENLPQHLQIREFPS